jgi:hypothetical protein
MPLLLWGNRKRNLLSASWNLEPNVETRCYENDMDTINMNDLMEYVKAANVATFSHLGPSNFNKVERKGRPLVIGVISSAAEAAEEMAFIRKTLAQYAMTGPEAIRENYYHGLFDKKAWGP